jgi:endonuclease/exonuclease/phosphatase family metal-dependent hydrolase
VIVVENKIKLLTLNIHKGWSIGRLRFTIEQLKKNIVNSGANVVCLQEVVGEYPELTKKSQFEFLADGIWSHYAYGKNAIYSKGHYGNAILSELPFINYENVDISNYRLERRGILHGVISSPANSGQKIHIMTLHLDLTGWGRTRQLEKLCKLIDKKVGPKAPLIVCGDFNDWREKLTEYLNKRVGLEEAHFVNTCAHAKTYPTFFPLLKLDRIYFRNISVEKIFRLDAHEWHQVSDHLGLYAVFTIP